MTVDETDGRFIREPSTKPRAGCGVFARVPLQKGDCLEVIGVLIHPGSVADQCTTYGDAYKYQVDGLLLLPVGYGGVVNHSSTPNMEKRIEHHRLGLRAIRDIAAGEELFFRYSDYAQERYHLS